MAGPHQLWQHVIGSDEISVFAGSGAEDVTNGPLKSAALAQPSGLTTDGNVLFVADSEGSAIRQVGTNSDSEVSTLAGPSGMKRGRALFEFGDVDGTGITARMQHPLGVAYLNGKVFVADSYNHKIRQLDVETRKLTTFLGDGKSGNGTAPLQLSEPGGVSVTKHTLYVADTNNNRVCAVRISDGVTAVMSLPGLEPPKPPRKSGLGPVKPIVLDARKVAPGKEIAFEIALDIPEGYKLNKKMPILWLAENAGEGDGVLAIAAPPKSSTTTTKDSIVRIKVPVRDGITEGQVQVSLRYGYCRDGVGGLCKISTKAWRVPVTLEPNGADKLVISTNP